MAPPHEVLPISLLAIGDGVEFVEVLCQAKPTLTPSDRTMKPSRTRQSKHRCLGQSWRIHLPIALCNPKPCLQSAAESYALCPIPVVTHGVSELHLGGWAGWQIQVVRAAGYNTFIFTRPAGATLNFICFGINIHYVVLDTCSGRTVRKYQSWVDDLKGIAHMVISMQSATFALSLPRFGGSHIYYFPELRLLTDFLSDTYTQTADSHPTRIPQ
ncbi:hypothetical protein B0H14DRAFT_2638230 [Mycena olivaceomarginata]|nr:hypothetical protein B0H14DRAFT_2638230 [Mycena olivaceomarginata]